MNRIADWIRVALKDLRGDLRRFGVLLACLALGTGTIAAVGSVGAALQGAIVANANILMGGDFEATRPDREATPDEVAFLKTLGRVAETEDTNARGMTDANSAFLDILAVDDNYPLLGNVKSPQLALGDKPAELLTMKDGAYGAIIDPVLIERLGVNIGDTFTIGGTTFQARGLLTSVPDGAVRGFHLGLTTVISMEALKASPDARAPLPGLLTHHRYKVSLNPGETYAQASAAFKAKFPDPDWLVQSPYEAAGNLARYYDLFVRFLLIVGLSSLLVGGVGVFNAVSAYLQERQRSIATLRSLGATSARIMVHFLTQIGVLSLVGIVIGVAIGAFSTAAFLPVLGQILGVELPPQVDITSLLTAIGFGLLSAFAFSYLPLVRAQKLKPALLFRTVSDTSTNLSARELIRPQVFGPLLIAAALIFGLAWITTHSFPLVGWYAVGVIVTFLLLRGAGLLLQFVLKRLPPLPNAGMREAFKSIYAPGSPAPVVVMSLGLGLAMLLVIVMLANNLQNQLLGDVTKDAPTFVGTDMFDDEVAEVKDFLAKDPNVVRFQASPMLRGAITKVNGVDSKSINKRNLDGEAAFMLDGEIPMTWLPDMPSDTKITDGKWWPSDYDGPPLVSLRDKMKTALGLKVGDTIEITMFGDSFPVTIANFRDYQFQTGLNFLVTLSPHSLDGYPATWLSTIKAAPGHEKDVERELAKQYPELNFIPIGDALNQAATILSQLGTAVDIVGALAVLNGVLVLAGTMAAGRKQREADAVIRKVLGNTRADVLGVFVLEYSLLGVFSAIIATVVGIVGAWAVTQQIVQVGFAVDPLLVLMVLLGSVALTILTGAITTWSALSTKPASYLRSAA